MPSTFDANFAATAGAAIATAFGGTATYTDTDGTATALTKVIYDIVSENDEETTPGEGETERAMAYIQTSELAAVERHATVTVDGVTWTVDRAVHAEAGELAVPLTRQITGARHGPGYRGRR